MDTPTPATSESLDAQSPSRLDALEQKIDAIYVSVERTRKYFLWTMIISIAVIVLPLIGLAFAIPRVISTYSSQFNALQ